MDWFLESFYAQCVVGAVMALSLAATWIYGKPDNARLDRVLEIVIALGGGALMDLNSPYPTVNYLGFIFMGVLLLNVYINSLIESMVGVFGKSVHLVVKIVNAVLTPVYLNKSRAACKTTRAGSLSWFRLLICTY